jgi:hypothetical protein
MTRHGKIARLPRAVREELNQRLDNGESGVKLAKWLNRLKEVKKVLRENFGGRPITPQNLSEWKCGGFVEWQARQESLGQARELSAQAKELEEATECTLADHLGTVLTARYGKVVSGWDGRVTEEFSAQLRVLRSMCLDVAELRRGDHSRKRVILENRRLHQNRERTDREMFEMFQWWASHPAVRDWVSKEWETQEEKEERLEEIFRMRQEYEKKCEEQEEGEQKRSVGVVGEEGKDKRSDGVDGVVGKGAAEHAETIAVDRSKSNPPSLGSYGAASPPPLKLPPSPATARRDGAAGQASTSTGPVAEKGPEETGGTPVPLANAAVGGTPAPLAAAKGGTLGSEKGTSQSQERADEASALLSPSAAHEGETIGVDPSKSDQERAGASSFAEATEDRRARGGAENGAGEMGETPVPLTKNEELKKLNELNGSYGTNGDAPAAASAAATQGVVGAKRLKAHQMVDGIMLGMSAKMLLKKPEERYALLEGGVRVGPGGCSESIRADQTSDGSGRIRSVRVL